MNSQELDRLERTRGRALRILADCSPYMHHIEIAFPARAAAALREIARLCVAQAYHLDQIKEETDHG